MYVAKCYKLKFTDQELDDLENYVRVVVGNIDVNQTIDTATKKIVDYFYNMVNKVAIPIDE